MNPASVVGAYIDVVIALSANKFAEPEPPPQTPTPRAPQAVLIPSATALLRRRSPLQVSSDVGAFQ